MRYLIAALMLAALSALVMGIWQMARGGDSRKSNRLMVWRVGLQAAAVALLGVLFLFRH